MAESLSGKAPPDPRKWDAVEGYKDKYGKPLKFARIGSKPGNTGHYFYVTNGLKPWQIEELAAENKQLQKSEDLKRQNERQRQLQLEREAANEEEMAEQGFGEENYFTAKQIHRAQNARHGTKYLLYKHHLDRYEDGFSGLPEDKKRERVKEFQEDQPHLAEEFYYPKIVETLPALGYSKEYVDSQREDFGGVSPSQIGMMSLGSIDATTGLYQGRDEYGDYLPNETPAPVLRDKYRGLMGYPGNYGTPEFRQKAYDRWKDEQQNQGAFNQYMGSINPIV